MMDYTHVQKIVMDSIRSNPKLKNKTVNWFIWKTVIHDDNDFYLTFQEKCND